MCIYFCQQFKGISPSWSGSCSQKTLGCRSHCIYSLKQRRDAGIQLSSLSPLYLVPLPDHRMIIGATHIEGRSSLFSYISLQYPHRCSRRFVFQVLLDLVELVISVMTNISNIISFSHIKTALIFLKYAKYENVISVNNIYKLFYNTRYCLCGRNMASEPEIHNTQESLSLSRDIRKK